MLAKGISILHTVFVFVLFCLQKTLPNPLILGNHIVTMTLASAMGWFLAMWWHSVTNEVRAQSSSWLRWMHEGLCFLRPLSLFGALPSTWNNLHPLLWMTTSLKNQLKCPSLRRHVPSPTHCGAADHAPIMLNYCLSSPVGQQSPTQWQNSLVWVTLEPELCCN